uniref:NADPH-dependent FMN reductase n=1 Tax=Streptomyces albus subsp. albus TaxID=67257 RepID=W5QK68_9ACTN|nr:NADPH-dependent FMN reductase [Streptomyces albus subsp. albus]
MAVDIPGISAPQVGVVVGNPKPTSRTYQAARYLAEQLTGLPPDPVVDLADFGTRLLDWTDESVAETVKTVTSLDLVVFASPTYKASVTGLLKLFLDRFPLNGLDGVVAVPLMLGGGPSHALAPELFLKPVLAELGATLPTRSLFVLEGSYNDPDAFEPWISSSRARLAAALRPAYSA